MAREKPSWVFVAVTTSVNVVSASRSELFGPPDIVDVVGVAAVDDNAVGLHKRGEVVE